ncbi:GNAT family N-acetyltransferase [Catenuloplanes japonicus]|uniref:GNAT family N-acetyltransferase n=1 Tax=Catenuloplanes japonicus TaxID=33876 RepID=UPI000AB88CB8|nr:GNAT family N-acetyltransferase [Catenuloplanes japonicus]
MSDAAIRRCAEPDVEAAAALLNLTSAVESRTWWADRLRQPGVHAIVADEGGRVAGAALLGIVPNFRGQLPIGLAVAEAARGRGIGTALARNLAGHAATLPAPDGGIGMVLRDDQAGGLRFAERLGLAPTNHCIGWIIALADAAALRESAAVAAARAGVRLAESTVARDRERLVEATAASVAGMPSDTPMDLAAFAAAMPDDGVLVFADDDEGTAGVALIRPDGAEGGWHTSYTGVAVRARRRGVARALKLGAFAAAAGHGGTTMHSENDERNAPMLALSEAMGMRRGRGYWSLAAKRLTRP